MEEKTENNALRRDEEGPARPEAQQITQPTGSGQADGGNGVMV